MTSKWRRKSILLQIIEPLTEKPGDEAVSFLMSRKTKSTFSSLRWFLSTALRIPTAHDSRVIKARKWVCALAQRKRCPTSKARQRNKSSFSLKRAGWPIFLLHNYSTHVLLFNLKKYRKEKNIQLKSCTKLLFQDAIFDPENNNSTHALRPPRFKWCDFFPQSLYDLAPYAPDFHPVKFSPRYYLDKLCFQLPQNVTRTDE